MPLLHRRSYLRPRVAEVPEEIADAPRSSKPVDLTPPSGTVAALVIAVVPLPGLDPNLDAAEFRERLGQDARAAIDEVYGAGTAKRNPHLVANVMAVRFEHWFGAWNVCTFEDIENRHPEGIDHLTAAARG